jgi:hypothetical protein
MLKVVAEHRASRAKLLVFDTESEAVPAADVHHVHVGAAVPINHPIKAMPNRCQASSTAIFPWSGDARDRLHCRLSVEREPGAGYSGACRRAQIDDFLSGGITKEKRYPRRPDEIRRVRIALVDVRRPPTRQPRMPRNSGRV